VQKPKWMRQHTFDMLRLRAAEAELAALMAGFRELGLPIPSARTRPETQRR
jgi:hypothetical protein